MSQNTEESQDQKSEDSFETLSQNTDESFSTVTQNDSDDEVSTTTVDTTSQLSDEDSESDSEEKCDMSSSHSRFSVLFCTLRSSKGRNFLHILFSIKRVHDVTLRPQSSSYEFHERKNNYNVGDFFFPIVSFHQHFLRWKVECLLRW